LARQKELYEKLNIAYSAEDIDAGSYDGGKTSAATFRLTDGAVPIAPPDSAGKRLVGYLLSHREKRP
jgi:hypothetical protein